MPAGDAAAPGPAGPLAALAHFAHVLLAHAASDLAWPLLAAAVALALAFGTAATQQGALLMGAFVAVLGYGLLVRQLPRKDGK